MQYHVGKPVEHRPGKWRCLVTIEGRRRWGPLATEPAGREREEARKLAQAEATREANAMAREAISGAMTMRETIEAYLKFRRAAGSREQSVSTAGQQLRLFFAPVLDSPLIIVTAKRAAELYERLRTVPGSRGKVFAVATQRHCLMMAKSLFMWCVGQRLVSRNPLADLKAIGMPHRGKSQLRIDEARILARLALRLAAAGDDGGLAVLLALVMGMRAGEIVTRTVRDIDDSGLLLWVDETVDGWRTKSRAARRALAVPEALRPLLCERARGKMGGDPLFEAPMVGGRRHRNWVRESTLRLCEQAGLPRVCAHSLRGLHATIAIQAGASPALVASALGHEEPSMTLSAYAVPGSLQIGQQHQVTALLMPNPKHLN